MRTQCEGKTWLSARRAGIDAVFERLDAYELHAVRKHVGRTDFRPTRGVVLVVNRMFDGMIYPLLGLALFAMFGHVAVPAIVVATGSTVLAHLCYPAIKRGFRRMRPCDRDPSIRLLSKPLDFYSFPSGHSMTATAAFLPLSGVAPGFLPMAALVIWLMGWARLAAGHHYPSDVFAGILLGALFGGMGLCLAHFWH